jgi:ATP-dependent RNA/DNA helicase IGHMBP2
VKELREKIQRFVELLAVEKDEDYKQYVAQFARCSIAERRRNGVTWYPLNIIAEELGAGDYLILEVERTQGHNELHQFSNGKLIELFSNSGDNNSENWKLQGTIRQVWQNRMRIQFSTDELPGWAERGKLGINLLFDENSYREMLIALQKVMDAERGRLAELRDILYGYQKAAFDKKDENVLPAGLNRSQADAVRTILAAKDVAIVHGPPGTGKTTTLVQAIRHTLMHEKQVLVCSPSNTAVDLLTERLVRQGINVLRLGNPARVSDEVMNNTLDVKMTRHANYKELKEFRKRAEEYFAMAKKYKRNFGRDEREQRNLLYTEARQLLKDATTLEDYILWDQFEQAQVVACTPVVSAGKLMRDKRFGTVFIDEAAQALEPMSWIPITRANRVVFAGDHCQLPPTVKSKKAEDGGLKFTLFERAIHTQPHSSVLLETQYRMHENIMTFSNREFYDNRLLADLTVKNSLLSFDENDDLLIRPLEFIDTAGCGFTEQQNPETLSLSNPEEAALLLKHLGRVIEQYDSHNASEPLRIGIIAPYKQQTELLALELTQQSYFEGSRHHFSVRTVDGFQGQERDIICISLVRSNDNGEIGFLADTRRMNVALTRAKRKLIVFGDSATLANHSFYKSFLNYVDEIEAYRSAWEFMDV